MDPEEKIWDFHGNLKIRVFREPLDGEPIIEFIDKSIEMTLEKEREWKKINNIWYSENPYKSWPILDIYDNTDKIREALNYYDKLCKETHP